MYWIVKNNTIFAQVKHTNMEKVMICRGINSKAWIPLKMGKYFYDFDEAVAHIKKCLPAIGNNLEIKIKLGDRLYIHSEN